MRRTILRNVAIVAAFSGPLLVGPTESKAIFHWCRGCGAAPAAPPAPAYVPPPAVSYYAPCAPPTVVNYVPQTYLRPVVVNTPVTTYQPVTSCGLCGPTTTMRPVTTMVQQTQYVPYNSYRLVYSAAMPVVTANYLAPAIAPPPVMAPAPPPAPACCGQGAPAAMAPAPPIGMGSPAPGMSNITPTPSLNGPVPNSSGYGSATTPYAPSPYLTPNTAPNMQTYSPPATPGSANYGPTWPGATQPGTTLPGTTGTTQNYGSSSNSSSTVTPSAPANNGTAPSYDPLNPTSPPDIHLKPVPEDPAPQAGPTSRPADADARTASRTMGGAKAMPTGVIPAMYTQPTAPMPNVDWRPSSR
ncbi:MAG TPA: hypothetical protein VGN12_13215 [Pirellulales bacterium]